MTRPIGDRCSWWNPQSLDWEGVEVIAVAEDDQTALTMYDILTPRHGIKTVYSYDLRDPFPEFSDEMTEEEVAASRPDTGRLDRLAAFVFEWFGRIKGLR